MGSHLMGESGIAGRKRAARNVVVPKSYPDYMFGLKLMEKLKKGYQDKYPATA